jgi:hypothetical protein
MNAIDANDILITSYPIRQCSVHFKLLSKRKLLYYFKETERLTTLGSEGELGASRFVSGMV